MRPIVSDEEGLCPTKIVNKRLLCRILLQKTQRPGKPIGKHKANRGVLCLRLMQSAKKSLPNVVRLPLISKRGSIRLASLQPLPSASSGNNLSLIGGQPLSNIIIDAAVVKR